MLLSGSEESATCYLKSGINKDQERIMPDCDEFHERRVSNKESVEWLS